MAAVWVVVGSPSPQSRPIVRSMIVTPEELPGPDLLTSRTLAMSPDGTRVVYGSVLGNPLRVHVFDRLDPEPLPGTEGASSPAISPDGQWVAYFDQPVRMLKRVSIRGGPVSNIARTDGLLAGLSWSGNDALVFATERSDGLFRVAASGAAEPERLTTVAKGEGEVAHRWPSAVADGRRLLFTVWRGSTQDSRIAVVSVETREVTELRVAGSHPVFVPTGYIVYVAGNALRAVAFDPERLLVTNDTPIPLDENVRMQANGAAHFDVSANGSLVYVLTTPAAPLRTLVWVDRRGREEVLDPVPRVFGGVRISPDGSRLVSAMGTTGRSEIWIANTTRPTWNRLTIPPNPSGFGSYSPSWTPDGQRVIFQNELGRLAWTAADGTGTVEPFLVIDDAPVLALESWMQGGQGLFVYGTAAAIRIGLTSLDAGADDKRSWRTVIDMDAKASGPSVSPDGHWVAYQSFDSGKYEVYLAPFPQLGDRVPISGTVGGSNPMWSPDGKELYYRRLGDGAMMAVPIQTFPKLTVGTAEMLFDDQALFTLRPPEPGGPAARSWDVAQDGRFLMTKRAPDGMRSVPVSIVHVQNWIQELQRLVPSRK
jgi:Tol biopolymer transport system component